MTKSAIPLTVIALGVLWSNMLFAQESQSSTPAPMTRTATAAHVDRDAAGDSPDNPGPLATDLSPRLARPAIQHAMRKVADWQLAKAQSHFNRQWTYAALYDGLLAASAATGDADYRRAVERFAKQSDWMLIDSRFPHADDLAMGRAYLGLYQFHPDPIRIADTGAAMDRLIALPDDGKKNLWWWCDALFMAPPVLARLSAITGQQKYLDFMDRQWWITSAALYDPQERLFFRDDSYLDKRETNGKKLFWSRGNGWVLAGLVSVLQTMPRNYPDRPRYVAQFQAMAERIASLQQQDGLWRSGLLDPGAYSAPEVSGSAFFTYAFAWGVNAGLLPRATYLPVITRAWQGLLQHVYADGRLGSIQPIGAAPDAVKPSSSYVYGIGAFLLAGSELLKISR